MHIDVVMAKGNQSFFADIFGIGEDTEGNTMTDKLPYYDLVAVLVDDGVYGGLASYDGLIDEYESDLNEGTLKARIVRYGEDLEKELEGTKVYIIEVEDTDTSVDIRDMLENLYFEGDGEEDEESHLIGTVLIGDIPLPVVNKEGNYIPSVIPYVDFEEKSYIYNPETQEFEFNNEIQTPKAEIWHGVIRPPRDGVEGASLLAEYFDKNHLYHIGHPDFAEFDQKLFYADLNFQKHNLNESIYNLYQNYIKNAEDLAYNRFTNKWLGQLTGNLVEMMKEEMGELINDGGDPGFEEAPTATQVQPIEGGNALSDAVEEGIDLDSMAEAMSGVPDIFTKDMIEKYHASYTSLFTKYLSKVNDFAEYTGRWGDSKETPVSLIAKKDFFTRYYLRLVNDMIEEKIDAIVENDLQKKIKLPKQVVIQGTIDVGDEEDLSFKKTFFNHSLRKDGSLYVNGVPAKLIDTVEKCSLNRGSYNDESQLVEMNRIMDSRTLTLAPKLGLLVDSLTPEEALSKTDGKYDYGAEILKIVSKSGADETKAFTEGSILLTIDGEKITQQNSVLDIITKHERGDKVAIKYILKAKKSTGYSEWIETSEEGPIWVELKDGKYGEGIPSLGANAEILSPSEAFALTDNKYNYGAVVRDNLVSGTPAIFKAYDGDMLENPIGLKAGDVILEIDGKKINTNWTVDNALYGKHVDRANKDIVDVLLYRNGKIEKKSKKKLTNFRYFTAGCEMINFQNPQMCSPSAATVPVYDAAGGTLITDAIKETDFRSCYNFKPYEFMKGVPYDIVSVYDSFGIGSEKQLILGFKGPDSGYGFMAPLLYIDDDTDYLKMADNFYERAADLEKNYNKDEYNNVTGVKSSDGLPDQLPIIKTLNPYDIIIRYKSGEDVFSSIESLWNSGLKVKLQEIALNFGRMDRIDNDGDTLVDEPDEASPQYAIPNSWDEFSKILLETEVAKTYCTPVEKENDCSNDAYINFQVIPEFVEGVEVSSVVKHKEPTNQTVMEQVQSGTANVIPVDDPRYISFALKNKGTGQKVVYPNIFDAKSYEDFVKKVQTIEAKLNGLSGLSGVGKNYSGALTSLLVKPTNPLVVGKDAIADAAEWNNLEIDQKHSYVFETYLNPNKEAYIADTDKGFEAMYLVADGDELSFDIDFNGDTPDKDLEFDTAGEQAENFQEELDDLESGDKEKTGTCNIFTCWFPEIIEWLSSLVAFEFGFQVEQACGLAGNIGDGEDLIDFIQEMAKDEDGDGMPDKAQETARIELTVSKDVMRADGKDSLIATVTAYTAEDEAASYDSFSQIDLFIVNSPNGEIATLGSVEPATLIGGQTTFTLNSTDLEGKFTLYATTVNRPKNLTSNSKVVLTTKKSLKLTTFITKLEESKMFTQQGSSVFSITNDDGKEVAKVDENGKIEVTDNGYKVEIESEDGEPLTLSIKDKETGEEIASEMIIANEPEVQVTGVATDFDIAELSGVFIKDMIPGDEFEIGKFGKDCEKLTGNVYIMSGEKIYGIVTTLGQIVLMDPLTKKIKENTKNYPVIEVLDGDTVLFEFYAAPKFNSVNKYAASKYEAFVPVAYAEEFTDESSDPDTDGDGLKDLTELIIGTSALHPDTDSDGYTDSEELEDGYDPMKPSSLLFSDMSAEHPYYDSVIHLYKRGVLKGYADGTFKPGHSLLREEFVKIDLGVVCVGCDKFSEEKKGEVMAEYNEKGAFPDTNINPDLLYCVADAKNKEIVSGYKGDEFRGYFLPKNSISRAEAVKVILETVGIEVTDLEVESATWYFNYIVAAQREGIFPRGKFAELDSLSSEEFIEYYTLQTQSGSSFTLKTWLEDGITRGEFAYMASYILAKYDCYADDRDGDGIPDYLEENIFGTNPGMVDTDMGGVYDLEELVKGTDPHVSGDDAPKAKSMCELAMDNFGVPDVEDEEISDLLDGYYVTGNVDEELVFEESDEEVSGEGVSEEEVPEVSVEEGEEVATEIIEFVEYTDEVLADGQSILYARAEVLDSDNESIVQFSLVDGGSHIEIPYQKIKVQNGIAETTIKSKTLAGFANVRAELVDQPIPPDGKEIYAYPGVPVSIDIVPKSYILKAGGVSKTPLTIIPRDAFGNAAINAPYKVTVLIEDGDSYLDESVDEDKSADGIQLTAYSNAPIVDLISSEDPERAEIRAFIDMPVLEVFAEGDTVVSVRDDIYVDIITSNSTLIADSDDKALIQAKVVDGNYDIVKDFNGTMNFSVSDGYLGTFSEEPVKEIVGGQATIEFKPGKIAGKAEISALLNGFETSTFDVSVVANKGVKMKLFASEDSLLTDGDNELTLTAELYDARDNLVNYDSNTAVIFRITEATKEFAKFTKVTNKFTGGKANATLVGESKSGFVNIIAESPGLPPATLSIKVKNRLFAKDFAASDPNVLYVSLLGSSFGDILKEDYFGGLLTFAGKIQSVTSLLADPKGHETVVNIPLNGKLQINKADVYLPTFHPANDNAVANRISVKNIATKKDVFDVVVVPDTSSSIVITDQDIPEDAGDGFYIKKLVEDTDISYVEVDNGFSILNKNGEIGRIYQNGSMEIANKMFSVEYPAMPEETPFFHLNLMKGINNFANLYFVKSDWPSVQTLEEDESLLYLDPGVYVIPKTKDLKFEPGYSGNSTHNSRGYKVLDPTRELSGPQKPGFPYESLEDADTQGSVGFRGTNKHMLLFAAGNSVGVSNMYYPSEIGVVLGDPTVRIIRNPDEDFTQDIGSMIYQGDQLMQNLISIDFDSDGDKDMFAVYESGEIRLLERVPTASRFKDRGVFINLTNGIYSAVSGDFDMDLDDDLFISTKESCKEGELCMYLYRNDHGYFERESLNFDIDSKMYVMRSGDIDNDGDIDVIGSDTGGKILAFYNGGGTFEPNVQTVGNLGLQVDAGVDLSSNVWIHYSGIKLNDAERTFALVLAESESDVSHEDAVATARYFASEENVLGARADTDIYFNRLDLDPLMKVQSSKKMEDVNGENMEVGDTVKTTILLKNNSGSTLNNVFINDLGSEMLDTRLDSLECDGCKVLQSGLQTRPYVFSGFSIPAYGSKTISYLATVSSVPKVNISLGKDLPISHKDYSKDNYPDIQARPEQNPSGQVVYYHTDPTALKNSQDRIAYQTFVTPKPGEENEEGSSSAPTTAEDILAKSKSALAGRSADSDYDGLPDCWDNFPDQKKSMAEQMADIDKKNMLEEYAKNPMAALNDLADVAANAVEDAISFLTCSGGCLPMPFNYAFFVPGSNSIMQPPIPPIPLYVFGIMPSLPIVTSGTAPSVFRMYVSPTMTASVALSFCAGPYSSPPNPAIWCISVAPPMVPSGACDFLGDLASKAMSGAMSVVSTVEQSTSSGYTTVQANGSSMGAGNQNVSGDDATSFNLGQYNIAANGSVNVRIPGFPGVIVNWVDRQIENIITMLTDLPDIYILYPGIGAAGAVSGPDLDYIPREFHSSIEGFKNMNTYLDFMTALNRFPFVKLEGKEVVLKVPMITPQEIEKVKRDWEQWKVDFIQEIQRFFETHTCGFVTYENGELKKKENVGKSDYQTVCDKVFVDATKMIRAVEKNLEAMDEWKKFPKQILSWRQLEAKYIRQVICYLDVILNLVVGWMKKQQKRITDWIEAIEKIKKDIETWKAVIDLTLNYETACDECKSERFSTMELLLKLFMAIPSPPDIPLPKLPDFVFDFSKLHLGMKFIVPDLKLRPSKIIIPPIPRIRLPSIMPDIEIKLPDLPVIPGPPKIPDLPNLPPIPMIELPSLPKAPSIPKLPKVIVKLTATLEKILKILCLIKKGFIPVPEVGLKTQVESLTERGLTPVMPIEMAFAIKYPKISYSYVDQIKLTTIMNLQLDTNPMMKVIEKAAESWNQVVDDEVVKEINNAFKDFANYVDQITSPKLPFDVNSLKLDLESGAYKDYQNYFENYARAIEDFRDEYNVDGDQLRLEATINGYMDDSMLACSVPDAGTADIDDVPAMREELKLIASQITDGGFVSRMLAGDPPKYTQSEVMSKVNEGIKNSQALGIDINIDPEDYDDSDEKILRGIYIFTPETGGKKLMSYTEEMETESQIVYVDTDNDNDEDIILNIGGNIYIKENYKESPDKKADSDLKTGYDVNDFKPKYPSVNMFKSPEESNQTAEVNFKPANAGDLYGYEFVLHRRKGTHKINSVLANEYEAWVYVGGEASLESYERVMLGSRAVRAKAGSVLHAMSGASITLHVDDETTERIELEKYQVYKIPDSYVNGVDVEVFSGNVELIKVGDRVDTQELKNGMALAFGDEFTATNDDVIVKYPGGAEAVVEEGETFRLLKLSDLTSSSMIFELENGDYYANVYSFNKQGNRSTVSETALLSPQVCADKTVPFPVVSETEVREIILKEFEISAKGSFDMESNIVSFGLDLDSDGAIDIYAPAKDPVFKLGPYEKPQTFNAKLIVKDEANNEASQDITIEIYVPSVSLDEDSTTKGFVTGSITAAEADIPVKIVRKRGDSFDVLTSTKTDFNGLFRDEEMDLDEALALEDSEGNVAVEIVPEFNVKDGYTIEAYPTSVDPYAPTHIEIKDENGNTLLSTFFVADANSDVQIGEITFDQNSVEIKDMDENDILIVERIPADVEDFGGGVQVLNKTNNERLLVVDPAGNIYILNEDATLEVKEGEPFVFEVYYKGATAAFEIYIPYSTDNIGKIPDKMMARVPKFEFAPEKIPEEIAEKLEQIEFSDVPRGSLYFDVVQELRDLGILEGYKTNDGFVFKPGQDITRAEFTKIILKILCIYPREAAYKPPSFFSDIAYLSTTDPWYYAVVKESFFQGLITGYLGEKDPVTDLAPFKPGHNITYAEAAKIILEAANTLGIIALPEEIEVQEGEAWYDPYLRIAINLKPYAKEADLTETSYLLTAQETLTPNKILSRGEFAVIAGRVLDIYNCYLTDTDGDGLMDNDENKYGLDPKNPKDAGKDTDGDGLTDKKEILEVGTDPLDPDTDNGGVTDYDEYMAGTEPVNTPEDDYEAKEEEPLDEGEIEDEQPEPDAVKIIDPDDLTDLSGGLPEGLYIGLPECNACPCPSNIVNTADLLPQDTIFAIISNETNTEIYSKSNELTITKVQKHVE
ncbi:MAG: S-layer homology domain-containing protein [Patescibacteria group bacterium]